MNAGAFRPNRYARGRGVKISLDGLPSGEELEEAAERHQGEEADRFSLYTAEQVEALTKNAKIEMTFTEPIKIRDQAEMIAACMRVVIDLTKDHKVGSIRQRIETRREIASLVERLSIFNGRTPYGYRKKKR